MIRCYNPHIELFMKKLAIKKERGIIMIIAGFIFILAAFAVAVAVGGASPSIVLDLPSFVLVIFPPLVMAGCSGMKADLLNGIKALFRKDAGMSPQELRASARVFRYLYKASIGAGVTLSIIGGVIVLANLYDLPAIGRALSVGILSTLYGIIIGVFLYLPASVSLRAKADSN
jgi:flagellar motor component MotA